MKHFDIGSLAVIVVAFFLFVMALFFTGLTHALLLEIEPGRSRRYGRSEKPGCNLILASCPG
jgi:hypothetical protein